MTCQECELLLAGDERGLVDEHLAVCAACREFAIELRSNADAFVAMRAEPMPSIERTPPARWPWVAAAVAIAAVLIVMLAIPKRQALPAVRIASAAPPVVIEQRPRVQPVVHRSRTRVVRHGEPQILQVKMLTADPDVVIYWQIETKGSE